MGEGGLGVYLDFADAIERLGKMGAEAAPAVPVLRRLADREPEFRELVNTAIGRIEHPEEKSSP